MRLLSISHFAVVSEYRRRYDALAARGVDVHLVLPCRWTQFSTWVDAAAQLEAAPPQGWTAHPLQPRFDWLPSHTLRNVMHTYPGLEALVARLAPDLVEVWGEPYFRVGPQALAARDAAAPGAPLLISSAQNLAKWRPPPFSWGERRVLAAAAHAWIVSAEVEPVLRAKGLTAPTTVLPFGVDLARFRPREGPRPGGPLRVVFLGKLEHQKGADLLLEALARCENEVTASVVGAGPERARLEARVTQLRLGAHVRLRAPVASAEVPDLLRAHDVLVMPSRSTPGLKEQFGRSLIEAMACGLLVVGAASGEIPVVLGEAGATFPEGDVDALAARLDRAAEDPLWRDELAGRARTRAVEHWGWDTLAGRQVEVYEGLLAPGRGAEAA